MNQQRHRGGRRDFGRESKQDAFGSQDCLHFEQIGNYEHKGELILKIFQKMPMDTQGFRVLH